jgi:hypothetical protein
MVAKFSGFRTKLHEREIEAALSDRRVLAGMEDLADEITRNVERKTSGSSTLRPFGKKMSKDRVRDGRKVKIRVGTSWGPAVPVEYGGSYTPAHRILTSAAEEAAGKIGGF